MASTKAKTKATGTSTSRSRVFDDDALTPFSIGFTVRGVRSFFFNAANVDAYVAADERRRAGVKRLQKPDYEAKVWRHDGALAVPGNEFIKAMAEMARGLPDPTKSGAKSMRPIIPTALSAHEEFCPFFTRNGGGPEPITVWDQIDERLGRLGAKMGPIRRPKLEPGWATSITIDCIWPEVFAPADIVTLMTRAGQRGIGDATKIGMGRFVVVDVSEPFEISWT
jgi:hypothetical protein